MRKNHISENQLVIFIEAIVGKSHIAENQIFEDSPTLGKHLTQNCGGVAENSADLF